MAVSCTVFDINKRWSFEIKYVSCKWQVTSCVMTVLCRVIVELPCGVANVQVLKAALGMVAPDVEIDDGKGNI